ncbi:carbohydrate kinase [Pseudoclavibacter sp. RFBJ3]|uniref:carbohydrate kinase family protein n=1 Tax=unclassified Pseudoclavibacter TaxID=2615177 RepID=UPI000CE85BEC|nr:MULTISPECIES: carbohydrate kinase [unclassified Pseudoclavibacter]PPF83028.1 carbohydrate kinase [Pseudoclavibacter sp. RFBJ5]PPF91727.1 carbohydrate kinase [Pseudoclavibacter sp. RFBJ3]PPF95544.1 carbohydrate kinase [Pseudoclavibacter sp. RFBH5]PPG19587.1 carbohydrate kinase [Pseudoclavibacter sp. RFBI4]
MNQREPSTDSTASSSERHDRSERHDSAGHLTSTHLASTLVLGEALVDLLPGDADSPEGRALPGGSPMNVAVGLARLGHPSQLAARLADDQLGRLVLTHLEESGVALVDGALDGERTSTAKATLDAQGSASYEFDLDFSLPTPHLDGVDVLHTGSIGAVVDPGGAVVRASFAEARARGGILTSYDPNVRAAIMGDRETVRERVEALASLSHVVKLSDEDAEWLYPGVSPSEVLRRFTTLGARLAVMTRGSEGALARTSRRELTAEAPPVRVVDTVGAGDAFMSGLLHAVSAASTRHALVEGLDEDAWADAALATAARSAAVTVARAGANPPWPQELAGEEPAPRLG